MKQNNFRTKCSYPSGLRLFPAARIAAIGGLALLCLVSISAISRVWADPGDKNAKVANANNPASKCKDVSQCDQKDDGQTFAMTKTFNVAAGGTLTVDADRGQIEITTVDDDRVTIEVSRTISKKYLHEADEILKLHKVEASHEGRNTLLKSRLDLGAVQNVDIEGLQLDVADEVRQAMKQAVQRRLRNIRFRVAIPRAYDVNLLTGGGGIAVADLDGNVRCKTSGGSIKMGQVSGTVWAKTSGGCVKLAGCNQPVELRTSGGSITAGNVGGAAIAHTNGGSIRLGSVSGPVSAKTSGGSISITNAEGAVEATTSGGSISTMISKQPKQDCLFSTSGGSVNIVLADSMAFDIDARSRNGRVSADIGNEAVKSSKRNVDAKMNGGGPKLVARTSAGSVRISLRKPS